MEFDRSMADPRSRKSIEDIEKSLETTCDEDHLFEMEQSNELYEKYQELIAKCDEKIAKLSLKYTATIDAPKIELLRSDKYNAKKNQIGFDVESAAFNFWSVNVMRVPGMSRASLLRLMGELRAHFTEKFTDVKHFFSWGNLVPSNNISGGSMLSSKVAKRKNPVGMIFRQCANALKADKNPLGDYFCHMRAKGVICKLW